MKWRKFSDLQRRHPFIMDYLTWNGSFCGNKEFVQERVGFIAFRPFDKLSLSEKDSSSGTSLPSEYQHVQMERYEIVQYRLVFHVEFEPDGSRQRFLGTDIGDGSLQAHIDDVTEWFQNCRDFDDKQLVWERVVKYTVTGSTRRGISEMNLEIYPFPRFYRFRAIRRHVYQGNPSGASDLNNGELPPLIPGTLRLAF